MTDFEEAVRFDIAHDKRQCWPETWMTVAYTMAFRSHDEKTQVGAVIVSEDNATLLGLGYNGNYCGGPHQRDSLEDGGSNFLHAEENALIKCPHHYCMRRIMYVTVASCLMCAKRVLNAKISAIIYDEPYRDMSGVDLLKSTGRIEVYDMRSLIGDALHDAFKQRIDLLRRSILIRESLCADDGNS